MCATARDLEPSGAEVRREIVAHQLDDVNALLEALAAALRDGDGERAAGIRASLRRYALAMRWHLERIRDAVLSYADEHKRFPDELLAPAFVLTSLAPDDTRTIALCDQLSDEGRAVLAHAAAVIAVARDRRRIE